MTAEEAITAIEEAASHYPIADINLFSEKVREDLALFRRQTLPPSPKQPSSHDRRYPEPQPEFSIPRKYEQDAEIWIVFSAFVACFLDPISFGSHAMGVFQELRGNSQLKRVAFVSDARREEEPEELELIDLESVLRDARDMRELVTEIGHALLGNKFNPTDIDGGTSDYA